MKQVGSYSCCYQTIKWRVLCLQVLCQSCFSISWLVFVRLINAVLCVWGNPPRLLSIPEYGGHNGTEKMNLPRTIQKVSHLYRLLPPPHKRKWVACDLHAGTNNDEIKDSGKQQWGDKIKQSSTKGYGNDSRHYLISFCCCRHMR